MSRPRVVAIVNSSPDAVELLRTALQYAGLVPVAAYTYDIRDGRVDIDAFMRQHRPHVVLYDVAVPYDANWALFQHLRETTPFKDRAHVITSTNAAYVQQLAGDDTPVYEVIGKQDDLAVIVRMVREAAMRSPW
jgi:CheY-like chemotaxis protein